ncbi:YncE family protein [Pajaroellobacter abortibovis]|uniref:Uncharacterized protein n=1 Tax=Pajaroellobacter abortibovis TaxID=1882918 RepID=A0A1L6MV84_9BACT|nr:hypothetical protein [Pajaroellobacter abortibovis]APR99406.1 hypothetical protein BCY86_00960 [Pajaroellobacter abortibovis]
MSLFWLGCYGGGGGVDPPSGLYFPVSMEVSRGGNALYVLNSDFDLRYNGSTLESLNLAQIRLDAARAIANPLDPLLPRLWKMETSGGGNPCPHHPPLSKPGRPGEPQLPGDTCIPRVNASRYEKDTVVLGALGSEVQLKRGETGGDQLFVLTRGDMALTWVNVSNDQSLADVDPIQAESYPSFFFRCDQDAKKRCSGTHRITSGRGGERLVADLTMPAEPFSMAQSVDGSMIVVVHQSEPKASLFITSADGKAPTIQFVLEGLPLGGVGIAALSDGFFPEKGCSPSFLLTSRSAALVTLVRAYRPASAAAKSGYFLVKRGQTPLVANAGWMDSRGIAVDPTLRISCKLRVAPVDLKINPPRTQAQVDEEQATCLRLPERVFLINRSPPSLLIGEVGDRTADARGNRVPEQLRIASSIPLPAGPSRVYLAPIVDTDGRYSLRVFIICFDASLVIMYDPDRRAIADIIQVESGPHAMAFDPFSWEDVARRAVVPKDARWSSFELQRYQFGYVASFRKSSVQVLDLMAAHPTTFGRPVLTLGAAAP